MAITIKSGILIKKNEAGEELWIYPITTADNVMHGEKQLDEEIDEILKSIVVDSELSSTSVHAVQNKVIYVALNGKVDKVSGKGLSTNDYTTAEKNKLSGIAEGATNVTVDSTLDSASTNAIQNKAVSTELNKKVDKVSGKGLSTNDYTTAEKEKLAGIAAGANKTTVDSALSSSSTNPVQNKVINTALGNKVDKVAGKDLSSNDFTDDLKTKLDGIAAGANKYVHPSYTNRASGIYKITVDATGHVSAATAVSKSDLTSLLGFNIDMGTTAPSSVTTETYFMQIVSTE